MTTETKDGGPAFPAHGSMGEVTCDGMTLRDYFAAAALPSVCLFSREVKDVEGITKRIVGSAYEIADAMLAARKERA